MAVLPEDVDQYRTFIDTQIEVLRSRELSGDEILWHYTTGEALLSIVESGILFATQVSCLSDSTEVFYSEMVLRNAFLELRSKGQHDSETSVLLENAAAVPVEALSAKASHWFVTCFSRKGDDLSQWRAYAGGENGYAIGFHARGLFGAATGLVAQVNYDSELHKKVAADVAGATIRFYREGIQKKRSTSPEEWAREFFPVWSIWIDYLSPMVKDPAFRAEDECRIVHGLQENERGQIKCKQKRTLMSRYLPLVFPTANGTGAPTLPIVEVMVGPSRHKEISRISVDALMRNNGYINRPVTCSAIPFQVT